MIEWKQSRISHGFTKILKQSRINNLDLGGYYSIAVPVGYAREFVCLISCVLPRCNHILTHRFVMYICVISHNGLSTTNFDVIIIIRFRQLHSHSSTRRVCNRPFPSSLVPLFQNESKCETFHMKMSSAFSFIFMQIKVIFIRIFAHLNPLWNRGTSQGKSEMAFWLNLIITNQNHKSLVTYITYV